jgi:hypothetical protein
VDPVGLAKTHGTLAANLPPRENPPVRRGGEGGGNMVGKPAVYRRVQAGGTVSRAVVTRAPTGRGGGGGLWGAGSILPRRESGSW